MKLAEVSVKRPIFTTMFIMAFVVFGIVLYLRLPVDMLPNVDPPIVTVTIIYPGASPETMESQVTEPIEGALGTLGGVDLLRSVCMESVAQIIIRFDLDVDVDVAVQDVRDRVAAISHELPDGAEEPRVEKVDLGAAPVLQLAVTGSADTEELSRFAEDVVQPTLQQLDGVGQVELLGSQEREIHVYLDPAALRSHGLTALEVVQSLAAQNIEIPGGRIERGDQELILRTDARASSATELSSLAIATIPMGGVIRLGDVARVVDGVEERRSLARMNGEPAVALVVRKQSGENTVEVTHTVREALPRLEALAPPGVELSVLLDGAFFTRTAVESVQVDLAIGALLAVLIIFVFLRDLRTTFITALALPTSVIGTFAFIKLMGFSLNVLTMLALSLSIGILVDDAIVVIENISRRRTSLGESAREATLRGTAEIGFAVIATTLSLVAVFIPVSLTQGLVGKFLFEFGVTVAIAVLLSLLVSFTLTPMLTARLLVKDDQEERGLSRLVGRALDGLDGIYRLVIAWVLRHRLVTLSAATLALAATVAISALVGGELVPPIDRGQFTVSLELPPGTSLERTADESARVAAELREIPGVESTFTRVGGGALGQVNNAEILVSLVPRAERAYSESEALAYVRRQLARRRDLITVVESLPVVEGILRMVPIEIALMGDDLEMIAETAQGLVDRLEQTPGFVDVDSTARPGSPELHVELDRARAADLGILGAPLAMTVRTLVAGQVATHLDVEGDKYDVLVQLPPELRTSATTLEQAQIRTPLRELIDVGAVARVVEARGPNRIDRQDRRRQVTVTSNLEGLPQGEAQAMIDRFLADDLPAGVTYEHAGYSALLGDTINNLAVALLLAVICIYMTSLRSSRACSIL